MTADSQGISGGVSNPPLPFPKLVRLFKRKLQAEHASLSPDAQAKGRHVEMHLDTLNSGRAMASDVMRSGAIKAIDAFAEARKP